MKKFQRLQQMAIGNTHPHDTPSDFCNSPIDVANSENSQESNTSVFHGRTLNLSNVEFSDSEITILDKGLKFTPSFKPTSDHYKLLATKVESILQFLNNNNLPSPTSSRLLDCFKSNYCAKNKTELNNLNSIKQKISNHNLIITKADKGSCTVILNKTDYIQKSSLLLQPPSFTKLKKTPLKLYQDSLRTKVKQCSEFFTYFKQNYLRLIEQNPQTPRFYTLPKIHKVGIPHRPIVSFIGSPAYKLQKLLNELISTRLGFQSEYSIKNTYDLCKEISSLSIPPNYRLVSFDVENLFPSIPIAECLPLVNKLLFTSDIPDAVCVQFMDLLTLSLNQNFFLFNGEIFSQQSGLPMGAPLSPILAEIFLQNLEANFISKNPLFKKQVIKWIRYVDDVLVLFDGEEEAVKDFVHYLNTLHVNIKFTYEFESHRSLPFLDIKLTRSPEGLKFEIYRKQTHTDHVIPNDSNSPLEHKSAAFYTFFYRLFNIPLDQVAFKKEHNFIMQIAKANQYNEQFVTKIYKKVEKKSTISLITSLTQTTSIQSFSIPFINNTSYKLKHLLSSADVRISFATVQPLKCMFPSGKDKSNPMNSSGVYKLICTCGSLYIGRTYRSLEIRINEHKKMIRPQFLTDERSLRSKSAFAHHMLKCNKTQNSTDFTIQILHTNRDKNVISNLEIFEILKHSRNNNCSILNEIQEFPETKLIDKLINFGCFE